MKVNRKTFMFILFSPFVMRTVDASASVDADDVMLCYIEVTKTHATDGDFYLIDA